VAAVLGDPPKKRGNLCLAGIFYRKTAKGKRPVGHTDVVRVRMDGKERMMTGGSLVGSLDQAV